jgi:prepilin-type N-terminal cleavage/methylation domain-containing protein
MERALRGFTLIEILVVAALIVVLVGGSAVALQRGPSAALRSAEQIVAGLIRQAQGVALATQDATRLSIMPDEGQNFRALQVWCLGPEENWRPVGTVVYLPRGVAVVPPAGAQPAGAWSAYPGERSVLAALEEDTQLGGDASNASRGLFLQFEPNGDLGEAMPGRIVLAAYSGPNGAVVLAAAETRTLHLGSRGNMTSAP